MLVLYVWMVCSESSALNIYPTFLGQLKEASFLLVRSSIINKSSLLLMFPLRLRLYYFVGKVIGYH